MISHGALLEEVYGSDISTKKKKKDKKGRNNTVHFLPEMEKDLEKEKEKHIFPSQPENIDGFDKSFHGQTNVMPFGESNFFSLSGNDDVDVGRYSPLPPRVTANRNSDSDSNDSNNSNSNSNQLQGKPPIMPPTMRNVEVKQQLPEQPHPWDNGVKISKEDYEAFKEFIEFKSQQKMAMMDEQRTLSQNNEGFANVNDDFNDVLLFGLLGIFFLIFTDYIYKLGRKSY